MLETFKAHAPGTRVQFSWEDLLPLGESFGSPFSGTCIRSDYRARYYDESAGRFLSEDPIEFSGGSTNFYGYVKNNPARRVDPTGRTATVVVGEAGCLLGPEGCIGGAVVGALVDLTIAAAGSAAVALLISNIKAKIDAKPKPCDRKDDTCYQLYLADGDWCADIFTGADDTLYNDCMEIAWLNYLRCKQNQPRIEPDPRKRIPPKQPALPRKRQ